MRRAGCDRRQRIHDRAHVGRAIGAVAPGLGRGARAQIAMRVGPFRDREQRIGRQPVAPGLAELVRALEAESIVQLCHRNSGRTSASSARCARTCVSRTFCIGCASTPSSAAIRAATRAGQLIQASRSSRARRNTSAAALARSTSSPSALLQPQAREMRLGDLVRGARLHEGEIAAERKALFLQRLAHRADGGFCDRAKLFRRLACGGPDRSIAPRTHRPWPHRWCRPAPERRGLA